jgi:dUTP pyrophosphatase
LLIKPAQKINSTQKIKLTMKLPIKKWRPNAILPKFAQHGDAGADCFINGFKRIVSSEQKVLEDINTEEYTLQSLERIGCPLGFASAIPPGFYAAVVPRSGLALWDGLTILNTPGTIDTGYRNEWMAIVVNVSNKPVKLHKGDRICQFILRKLVDYAFEVVENLPDSDRGLGGFGSTGKK